MTGVSIPDLVRFGIAGGLLIANVTGADSRARWLR